MRRIRTVPNVMSLWRAPRPWIAASLALVMLVGCSEDPPDTNEVLASACTEASDILAEAPAPTDDGAREDFVAAAGEATEVVDEAIAGLGDQVDEQALQDMSWQLANFPRGTGEGEALRVAHVANAAILRIDRFAEALGVSECGAAAWRPAEWRSLADRLADDVDESTFRQRLDALCAETFPNPDMLAEGTPFLPALIGESEGAEDVNIALLQRLNSLNNRPADAGQFLRNFSDGLPEIAPSEDLADQHTALVAAFLGVEAVIPRVVPRNPSPEFRNRVDAVFEELERAWTDLDITC